MQFTFTIDLESERKKLYNEWYNNDDINKKHTLKRFLKLKATQKRIINKYQPLMESIRPSSKHKINYKILDIDSTIDPHLQVSFISDISADSYLGREFNDQCEQAYIKLNEWNASIQPWQKRKIITKSYDVALI